MTKNYIKTIQIKFSLVFRCNANLQLAYIALKLIMFIEKVEKYLDVYNSKFPHEILV